MHGLDEATAHGEQIAVPYHQDSVQAHQRPQVNAVILQTARTRAPDLFIFSCGRFTHLKFGSWPWSETSWSSQLSFCLPPVPTSILQAGIL